MPAIAELRQCFDSVLISLEIEAIDERLFHRFTLRQRFRTSEVDRRVAGRRMIDAPHDQFGDVRDRDAPESNVAVSIDAGYPRRRVGEEHGAESALHEQRGIEDRVGETAAPEVLLGGALRVDERRR